MRVRCVQLCGSGRGAAARALMSSAQLKCYFPSLAVAWVRQTLSAVVIPNPQNLILHIIFLLRLSKMNFISHHSHSPGTCSWIKKCVYLYVIYFLFENVLLIEDSLYEKDVFLQNLFFSNNRSTYYNFNQQKLRNNNKSNLTTYFSKYPLFLFMSSY